MPNSQIETTLQIKAFVEGISLPVTKESLIEIRNRMYSVLEIKPCDDEASSEHEKSIRWKRTAGQILEDGYVYEGIACTDQVVLFIALCHALRLETRFVKIKKTGMVHSVSEIKLDDGWYIFDVSNINNIPIKGEITAETPYRDWQLWKKGRDAWDLGLTEFDTIKKIQ